MWYSTKVNRSRSQTIGKSFLLCVLFFQSATFCQAETAGDQVKGHTGRLRQLLAKLNLSVDEAAGFRRELDLIDTLVSSGNLFQGIDYLQHTSVELNTYEYVRSKARVALEGINAFENEWKRVGHELDSKQKEILENGNPNLPAAVTALIECSLTQVQPYYKSGLLYGRNTTIDAGLYYVGLAPSNLDFALFCQRLKFPNPNPSTKLRSIEPELEALAVAVTKAFQSSVKPNNERAFIEINSKLKMARELNAERRYAGALKTYLDALLYFGSINGSVPELTVEALKKQTNELRTRLTASPNDETIGLIYIEMVLSAKSDAEMNRGAIIIEQVLPSYLKSQEKPNQ